MITPYHNNYCTAITQEGKRCNNLKNYNNNYCTIHNNIYYYVLVLDIKKNNKIIFYIDNINDIIKNYFLYYTNIDNFRYNIKYECNITNLPDNILNIIFSYIDPQITNNQYITKLYNYINFN